MAIQALAALLHREERSPFGRCGFRCPALSISGQACPLRCGLQEQELLVVAVASQVGPHVCDSVDEGVDPAAERVDPAGQSIEAGVHSGA